MKEETWQELDSKALTTVRFFLADKVLDEFSLRKTIFSLWEWLQNHYLNVDESVDFETSSLSSPLA